MKLMTKIYRQNIIDNVHPSDLNKDDIKLGLKEKEDLINSITDDYVDSIFPDAENIENELVANGISQEDFQKYATGQIDVSEVKLPEQASIKTEIWASYPKIDSKIESVPFETWTEIKESVSFTNPSQWTVMFKITISGTNHDKYQLINDSENGRTSGWLVYPIEPQPKELLFEKSEKESDSNKSVYITNKIKFQKSGNSEVTGVYLANEWIFCDHQISFLNVINFSLSCVQG